MLLDGLLLGLLLRHALTQGLVERTVHFQAQVRVAVSGDHEARVRGLSGVATLKQLRSLGLDLSHELVPLLIGLLLLCPLQRLLLLGRQLQVQSIVVAPAGSRSYTLDLVADGGAPDVARELAGMVRSFSPRR